MSETVPQAVSNHQRDLYDDNLSNEHTLQRAQYWLALINHTTEDGLAIQIDCNVYGDPSAVENYRAKFIEAGHTRALGQQVIRAGFFLTSDRRRVREVVFADDETGYEAVQLNIWDFQARYHREGVTERLLPSDDEPRLGLVINPTVY